MLCLLVLLLHQSAGLRGRPHMPIISHSEILDGGSTEEGKRRRDMGFVWTGSQ